VNSGVRWTVLGLVAATLLVIAPTASSGTDQTQFVASSVSGDCHGFILETLTGLVTGCRASPFIGLFGVAADGSIVVSGELALGDTAPVTLLRPNGQNVVLDSNPYDFDPAISPDGSKVAFGRVEPPYNPIDGPTDLFVVNSDGSDLTQVASGAGDNQLTVPTFSPDGGSIAYSCEPALGTSSPTNPGCGPLPDGSYGGAAVFLMNADGTHKRVILFGAAQSLSWSPDGQWITTEGSAPCTCPGNNNQNAQVFVYHTDGSDLFNRDDPSRQVTHDTADIFGALLPQFSADGTQILFLKTIDDSGNEGNFTYIINRDGTNRHEVPLSDQGIGWGRVVPAANGAGPPPTVYEIEITVPSVRTLSYDAAKQRLQKAHLRWERFNGRSRHGSDADTSSRSTRGQAHTCIAFWVRA
jgi:WD40-like Beta Propeller Repeat